MSGFLVGMIMGMIYQIILIYILVSTDDEILEKAIIALEACSIMFCILLALKGYVS